jgi:hypothetical protein
MPYILDNKSIVFSKLKPVKKVALSAPPVPTRPVIRPEIPPPVITIFLLVGTLSDGLTKNKADIIIKNIPKIILSIS